MDNESLMDSLVSWAADDARIYPPVFDCPYYRDCDASIQNALSGGDGCMMSYIGRLYGSEATDRRFRLVLVGIDHGDAIGGTFAERREGIEACYQNGRKRFNSHYRGLVKTAIAAFGNSGDYCRQKCVASCQKWCDPLASQCVIDRIVQPNSVKCTPRDATSRTSRATWPMKVNCAHHLANELKRLKPNLVVFHEASARGFIPSAFKACSVDLEAIEDVRDRVGPVLHKSDSLGAHVLFLRHPSRGWLDRQWGTVVVPALNYLRRKGLVPD